MSEQRAILAGGCFWGMQDLIRRCDGVRHLPSAAEILSKTSFTVSKPVLPAVQGHRRGGQGLCRDVQCAGRYSQRRRVASLRGNDSPIDRHSPREIALAGPAAVNFRRPCTLDPTQPVRIEAYVLGTLIECYVNDRHAFTTRAYTHPACGALSFAVDAGRATVRELRVQTAQ